MNLQRVGIDNDISRREVKVFNTDKKELVEFCESVRRASELTGIKPRSISGYITRKSKVFSPTLGHTIIFK